jgi:hypothetical protein
MEVVCETLQKQFQEAAQQFENREKIRTVRDNPETVVLTGDDAFEVLRRMEVVHLG